MFNDLRAVEGARPDEQVLPAGDAQQRSRPSGAGRFKSGSMFSQQPVGGSTELQMALTLGSLISSQKTVISMSCVELSAVKLARRDMYCVCVFVGPQCKCCLALGILYL